MRVAAWLWRYKSGRPARWYVRQTPFHQGAPVESIPLYRIPDDVAALIARALVFAVGQEAVESWTDEEIETMLEAADLLDR